LHIPKKFRTLAENDFRILAVAEILMKSHEFVPLEHIIRYSRLRSDEVTFRVSILSKGRFLAGPSKSLLGYQGYALTSHGYDALALQALVSSGVVEALGKSLGVGKEADIYAALDSRGKECAVKFHRLGRTSFRQTLRKRGYVAGHPHTSWLYQSRLAAEREYSALQSLYSAGVSVPKPIAHNRHVVVMSLIGGTELKFAELEDAKPILKEILRNIKKAYQRARLIHSDLSEYNILIKPDGKLLIIDWPQSVDIDHPNAQDYLKRDISNIVTCFTRKAGLNPDLEGIVAYVKGKGRLPTL